MENLVLTYKEYWGYYWRVTARRLTPGIYEYDNQLADLVEKVCGLKPGMEILELGCAGGAQLKLFARKGYRVTGVDFVPALIEHARKVFNGKGLSGELIAGDMRNIGYHERFDLVTMFSGTFGYFDDAGNYDMLEKIRRALKPGGMAFIDYLPLEKYYSAGLARTWHPIEGGYSLNETWYDVPTSTHRSRTTHIMLDGRIIAGAEDGCAAEVLRCYTAPEIEALAKGAGFTVAAHLTRHHLGNLAYSPTPGEPRGMLVVRKGDSGDE
jgi:SAM-dependent methyltransferase